MASWVQVWEPGHEYGWGPVQVRVTGHEYVVLSLGMVCMPGREKLVWVEVPGHELEHRLGVTQHEYGHRHDSRTFIPKCRFQVAPPFPHFWAPCPLRQSWYNY
ncbi:hypothetical protein HOLleu_08244 [Holothuria leucospilota]|uniref:Uncharacterized protein n=1 Tax=Holothuria leucospilota TaxID=206669 RepID=A0A9Q1HHQ3_HOLLE|nr:hypothetical protein HOLleu_08244 [Holothuria leucospilota]